MARAAETTYLQARESFAGALNGSVVEVRKGDLAASTSAVVRQWPDKFEPLEIRFTAPADARVEQATAAPGEKRGR
jgi:hypothetical protein